MGLLDSVMGAVTGHMQQNGGQDNILGGLLTNNSELGGLNGLVEKFQQNGMGDIVGSWIGKGDNLPISADQIASAFGSDTLSNIASQLGLDPALVSNQLAQMLPGLIDKLTPQGALPEGGLGQTGDLMGMLGGLLKG
ncbi:MAG: YidB family protein [Pseudomonadota bacterium]